MHMIGILLWCLGIAYVSRKSAAFCLLLVFQRPQKDDFLMFFGSKDLLSFGVWKHLLDANLLKKVYLLGGIHN